MFLRDLLTQTTTRLSVDGMGAEANGSSSEPVISGDGRFVAFSSSATNLAPGASSAGTVYVLDRLLHTVDAHGVGGAMSGSFEPSISDDGEILTYISYSALIPEDSNPSYDVYLEHRSTGDLEIVNADGAGTIAPNSDNGRVSADGSEIAFRSGGVLVPGAGTGISHLYLRRVADGAFTLVSRADDGRSVASPGFSGPSAMSSDARFVAWSTDDATLDPADANGTYDVFVRDLGAPTESASGTGAADSDGEADGATYLDPVETAVTGPGGSSVTIDELAPTQALPGEFTALGQQVDVHVTPGGTIADPIVLMFRFDASLLPAGADADSVHLFRNGAEVPVCSGAPSAIPDPCVADRSGLGDGDIVVDRAFVGRIGLERCRARAGRRDAATDRRVPTGDERHLRPGQRRGGAVLLHRRLRPDRAQLRRRRAEWRPHRHRDGREPHLPRRGDRRGRQPVDHRRALHGRHRHVRPHRVDDRGGG